MNGCSRGLPAKRRTNRRLGRRGSDPGNLIGWIRPTSLWYWNSLTKRSCEFSNGDMQRSRVQKGQPKSDPMIRATAGASAPVRDAHPVVPRWILNLGEPSGPRPEAKYCQRALGSPCEARTSHRRGCLLLAHMPQPCLASPLLFIGVSQ